MGVCKNESGHCRSRNRHLHIGTFTGSNQQEHGKKTRNFLIAFFSILTGYVLFNLLGQTADAHHSYGWAVFFKFTLFNESLLSSVLTVMLTGFLFYQSGEKKWYKNTFCYAALAIWGIYALLLTVTQFNGVFYSISDANVYSRGPYYPLLLVPPVLVMAVNLVVLWKIRKRLSEGQILAFMVYMLLPTACMLIQMRFFGIYVIVLGTSLAALFMLTFIINDQAKRYYMHQAENERLKVDILMAQIQPHFLCNSLATIRYLCRSNPKKAEEALSQFTAYLRYNMDSLAVDVPIPFEEELVHVKEYLALQKLRFEDDLAIEYELECTDFTLPTLTLQPLVENAVSYGVRKSASGKGKVTIRSKRYDDRIEISVMDDGPGFVCSAMADDRKRSHNGIKNVKERLERISGGKLVIDSTASAGTTAKIILPAPE